MIRLKKYFKTEAIHNTLDIATGKGQFIKLLIDIFPDASFTGIDPNEESLVIAKESLKGSRVNFRKMSAEKLEFEDGSFDVVSISNGLHHLPKLETSFSEIKRVLKPGGVILISELVSDNLRPSQENQKFYHHLRSYADRLAGLFHHETWPRQEILDIIKNNGIKVELDFDYFDGKNFITDTEPPEFWVNKLKKHFEILKGKPVYHQLLPKVAEFRQRVYKDGMEHATNVVVVGKFL